MSEHFEGERIKAVREKRQLNQEQFARILHITRSYLSELETNRRPVQPYIQEKIVEMERVDEVNGQSSSPLNDSTSSSLAMRDEPPAAYHVKPLVVECREHLERYLASCQGQDSRLYWTLVELQQNFPLNKWASLEPKPLAEGEAKYPSLRHLATQAHPLRAESPVPTPKAASPSDNKPAPHTPVSRRPKKGPRSVPAPAPSGPAHK